MSTSNQSPTATPYTFTTDGDNTNDDTTLNDGDGDGGNGGGSTEAVAIGISSMLSSLIRDCDAKAVSVTLSQDHLMSSLHRLTAELDQLLEDAPLPFIMQHAAKLSNVRRRVSSLNSVLRSIQRRLDNMDRLLTVGQPIDQTNLAGSK